MPGLLAQLPDFATGVGALEEGRYADALMPLQRATEVAASYFPATAVTERALCHSAGGCCLWSLGRYTEAAAQFEAGLAAARVDGSVHAATCANLAEAAARVHFELGDFNAAGAFAAEAAKSSPQAEGPQLITNALAVVAGDDIDEAALLDGDLAMLGRVNELVGRALPDGGSFGAFSSASDATAQALNAEFAEDQPLGQLLPPSADSETPLTPGSSSLIVMATRSCAGQLAVAAGLRDSAPWVRPLLVTALNDFEALKPVEPMLWPMLFRTLGALGSLLAHQGDFVTAEGLFRSAVDHVDEALRGKPLAAALSSSRACLWQAQLFAGFADLLGNGRRAEHRGSEISAWRERATAVQANVSVTGDARRLRWSLVYLPPPRPLSFDAQGA